MDDSFGELRATPKEVSEARTVMLMKIGQLQYKPRANLCYVCQKQVSRAECPICRRGMCPDCIVACANCYTDCCRLCAQIQYLEAEVRICSRCQ
jgi:hypothetical protein